MSIALHWYLPTHGHGRTLLQAGAAAQLLQTDRRGVRNRTEAAQRAADLLAPA